MMLMLLACLAAWALVGLMLGDARQALRSAIDGEVQTGGWVPSPLPMAPVRAAPPPSRVTRRR